MYTDTYSWIQLLLKTNEVMDNVNNLMNTPSKHKIINASFKVNILLSNIIPVIMNAGFKGMIVEHLTGFYDSYELDEALQNNYPIIINQLLLQKYNNTFNLHLIINENIETIPAKGGSPMPGGTDILLDYDEIVFSFKIVEDQLQNIMINLIPYL